MSDIVDLDALIDPNLAVKLDGKEEALRPLDGLAYHTLINAGDSVSVDTMYDIAADCLPTVPKERVMRLTPAQVGAVLKKAREAAEKVEALASPNSAPAGARTKRKV